MPKLEENKTETGKGKQSSLELKPLSLKGATLEQKVLRP
jgi:hypothetical protein